MSTTQEPSEVHPAVRAYLTNHQAVKNLSLRLIAQKKTYLTDKESQALGIEYSNLDFTSGTISESESTTSFFLPTSQEDYNMVEADVDFDSFALYPNSWSKRIRGASGRYKALISTYAKYATTLWKKFKPPTEAIMSSKGKRGPIVIHHDYEASTMAAVEFTGKQKAHHVLLVRSRTNGEDDRLTVAELAMATSWMTGGMKAQTVRLYQHGIPYNSFHIIFPVLILSFIEPMHARIIQYHFDNGKLKVQFTKLQQFDVPNYNEVMDKLIKWGNPIPRGDTILADKFGTADLETMEEARQETELLANNSFDQGSTSDTSGPSSPTFRQPSSQRQSPRRQSPQRQSPRTPSRSGENSPSINQNLSPPQMALRMRPQNRNRSRSDDHDERHKE